MENKYFHKFYFYIFGFLVLITLIFFGIKNVHKQNFSYNCESKKENIESFDVQNDAMNYISCDKPIIYLYGYNNEKVNVKLDFDGDLTCTYPSYNKTKGWNVTASKNGNLTDSKGQTYKYLFWEGITNSGYSFEKGYCVEGSKTVAFLEEMLPQLGLSRKEMGEFITYWLPRMQDNKYNVISFLGSEYTNKAKLTVTPAPDTTIRVFMVWYPSDEIVDIKEQTLICPKRTLPMVVEWGGAKLDNPNIDNSEDVATEDGAGNYTKTTISNKPASEYSFEENAAEQQLLLNRITELQQAALYKQPSVTKSTGHFFTDKNGEKTTFTANEWNKLLNLWAYTGQAEELIEHHTVGELRSLLGNM